jgi:hypothetical protein
MRRSKATVSRLSIKPVSTRTDLEKAIEGHVMTQAQRIGVYKRKIPPQNERGVDRYLRLPNV